MKLFLKAICPSPSSCRNGSVWALRVGEAKNAATRDRARPTRRSQRNREKRMMIESNEEVMRHNEVEVIVIKEKIEIAKSQRRM